MSKRDMKRQSVAGKPNRGKTKALSAFIGILIAAFVIAAVFSGGGNPFETVKAEAGIVRIPLSDIEDGKAHYFAFNGSKKINFFALKGPDGVVRTAFDACDICFKSKKGYRQEDGFMVCNNCGQRFQASLVNEVMGGCNPAPLQRRVAGGRLLIESSDIERGAAYF